MKLHIGCGTVYLTDGWTNVDQTGKTVFLAKDRPDLVERWGTVEQDYYAKHGGVGEHTVATPQMHESVCDAYGDMCALLFADDSADEILCRQVFEHLSIREARQCLAEFNRVLKKGGILRLDVPDHQAALEAYRETGRNFFKRHILGSQKCDSAWHVMGWAHHALAMFAGEYGFLYLAQEPNIHFYPAFCLRLQKVANWERAWRYKDEAKDLSHPWKAAWEYCGTWKDRVPGVALEVPEEWICVEVGPGGHPWARATSFVEPNKEHADKLGGHVFQGGIETLLTIDWASKPFDFAYCSHVLEHVPDPAAAIRGLEHVAKRGLIVCPSPAIEAFFAYHEPDHKWWVQNLGGRLVFQRVPKWARTLAELDMQGAAHRLWRLGSPNIGLDGIYSRRWYHRAEPLLETIFWWEDRIDFEVIDGC